MTDEELIARVRELIRAAMASPWTYDYEDDCQVVKAADGDNFAWLDGQATATAELISSAPSLLHTLAERLQLANLVCQAVGRHWDNPDADDDQLADAWCYYMTRRGNK